MTVKELREILAPLPDDTPVGIYSSDGTIDYATDAHVGDDEDEDGTFKSVIIAGN